MLGPQPRLAPGQVVAISWPVILERFQPAGARGPAPEPGLPPTEQTLPLRVGVERRARLACGVGGPRYAARGLLRRGPVRRLRAAFVIHAASPRRPRRAFALARAIRW